MPADWKFWLDYLQENEAVDYVAINCQTGYKRGSEAAKQFDKLKLYRKSLVEGYLSS